MKTFQSNPVKLLIFAIACSLAAGATTQAGAIGSTRSFPRDGAIVTDNARLVVRRAADFGTDIYLKLFVDGIQVTTLALNEGYEAIVRPGHHVLSIATGPSFDDKTKSTYHHVTMRRGQNYAFTALWVEADRATLVTPEVARHASLPLW
jgi:hypothetical protein